MRYKIFLPILIIIFLIISFDKSYDLKIEIETLNKNPKEIDEFLAKNLEFELKKINNLKNIIFFSSYNKCNIYFKFKPFINKNGTICEIERKLHLLKIKNYKLNDKYNLKYDCFVVITDENNNYDSLKQKADLILEKILKAKISNDIKMLGTQEKVNYVYFNNQILLNYDLTISDIKKFIVENNPKSNYFLKNSKNNQYEIDINSNIKNIEDLKNITFNYPNSNFSTNFANVFEIKKDIKKPAESKIIFNGKNAIIIAISRKKFCPQIYIKFILKNENAKIINPNHKKRAEHFFDNNLSIEKLEELIKNQKGLFFLNLANPKYNSYESFDEIRKNRIIYFIDKFENLNFEKEPQNASIKIIYKIKNHKLNEFKIGKKEVLNALQANNEGLICDYYWDKNDKIVIILKNKDKESFIYSKKLKMLIPQESIIDSTFEHTQKTIIRENFITRYKI